MSKSTWFAANRGARGATLAIFSEIGGFGVTVQDFHAALKALGNIPELNISVNSDGGDVSTGFAIFNMLHRHPAHKIVTIEGLAASMASVIAMAGDEIVMPANAMMMIHNPWGAIQGKADEVISFGEALEKMRRNIAGVYADRTKLGRDKIGEMMDRETWLTADEAVKLGFADRVEEPLQIAARFDCARFKSVPAQFLASLSEADRWTVISRRAWSRWNNPARREGVS